MGRRDRRSSVSHLPANLERTPRVRRRIWRRTRLFLHLAGTRTVLGDDARDGGAAFHRGDRGA
ncbi:hypothetical protein ACFPRL_35915 [Pseudoclavibacter helvolus]